MPQRPWHLGVPPTTASSLSAPLECHNTTAFSLISLHFRYLAMPPCALRFLRLGQLRFSLFLSFHGMFPFILLSRPVHRLLRRPTEGAPQPNYCDTYWFLGSEPSSQSFGASQSSCGHHALLRLHPTSDSYFLLSIRPLRAH